MTRVGGGAQRKKFRSGNGEREEKARKAGRRRGKGKLIARNMKRKVTHSTCVGPAKCAPNAILLKYHIQRMAERAAGLKGAVPERGKRGRVRSEKAESEEARQEGQSQTNSQMYERTSHTRENMSLRRPNTMRAQGNFTRTFSKDRKNDREGSTLSEAVSEKGKCGKREKRQA